MRAIEILKIDLEWAMERVREESWEVNIVLKIDPRSLRDKPKAIPPSDPGGTLWPIQSGGD
jgi:hypothetical protein